MASTPSRNTSVSSMTPNSTDTISPGTRKHHFFSKLLRKRSELIPDSFESTSTKISQSPTSPHTSRKPHKKTSTKSPSVSRGNSVKSKNGTHAFPRLSQPTSNRDSTYGEDDTSIVFDYDDDDSTHEDDDSGILSLTSSISNASLEALKLDAQAQFNAQSEPQWSGIHHEYFIAPKFTKVTKKNKHSPRNFNNIFLAQELNVDRSSGLLRDTALSDFGSTSDLEPFELPTSGEDTPRTGTVSPDNQKEIFVMEFSLDGKYLAVAGSNSVIKIWKVISSPLSRLESQNSDKLKSKVKERDPVFKYAPVFHQDPVQVFEDHTNSILSLDWSKNNFLISGSMDRTAKLWHVDRSNCLQTFQHDDFVTGVKFHPTDDRFYLSGSLDNEVRLWSIMENSVAYLKNMGDDVLVTAVAFTPEGKYCMVGGFSGSVIVLETNGLHYIHHFETRGRSIVNPFTHHNGSKITGIKIFENQAYSSNPAKLKTDASTNELLSKWNVLVTTNDSKIRLVNLNLKKLVTRFKGLSNNSSSIVASMSEDHEYIISGSEDHWCYIWENNNHIINNKLRLTIKEVMIEGKHHINDLNKKHKKSFKIIQKNKLLKKMNVQKFLEEDISAFEYVSNENSSYTSFHAHHSKCNQAIFAPEATKRLLEFSDDMIYDLVKRNKDVDGLQSKNSDNSDEFKSPELGHIIITTDQYGLIRVFRQDTAYQVRKKLIRDAKVCKSDKGSHRGSDADKNSLKVDNLNKKMNRSLSPSHENFSFKDKLHHKLKNGSTRSRNNTINSVFVQSPSVSPVSARFPTERSKSQPVISKVVSSSSLMNLRKSQTKATPASSFNDSQLHIINSGDNSETDSPSTVAGSMKSKQTQTSGSILSQKAPPLIINTDLSLTADGTTVDKEEVINFETPVTKLASDTRLSRNSKSNELWENNMHSYD